MRRPNSEIFILLQKHRQQQSTNGDNGQLFSTWAFFISSWASRRWTNTSSTWSRGRRSSSGYCCSSSGRSYIIGTQIDSIQISWIGYSSSPIIRSLIKQSWSLNIENTTRGSCSYLLHKRVIVTYTCADGLSGYDVVRSI